MKKTIYEQRNGTYCRQGNYLLPNLAVPENVPIGMWGQRHLRYIKEHRKGISKVVVKGECEIYFKLFLSER